jgi:hypothetical protein
MLLLVLFFAPKKRTDPFGSFRKEHRATALMKKRGLGNPPEAFFEEINDFLWKCERKTVILQPFLKRYTENEENTIVIDIIPWPEHDSCSPRNERLSSAILYSARDENRCQPVADSDAPDAARCHSPTAPARPQADD